MKKDNEYSYTLGDMTMVKGKVLEADKPRMLKMTFNGFWSENARKEPETIVTYEIAQQDGVCKLTITHEGFTAETVAFKRMGDGWNMITSNLKSMLETGKSLNLMPQM